MSPKTIAYFGTFFMALLVLAMGGWLVKGAKALTGRKQQPDVRARYA